MQFTELKEELNNQTLRSSRPWKTHRSQQQEFINISVLKTNITRGGGLKMMARQEILEPPPGKYN